MESTPHSRFGITVAALPKSPTGITGFDEITIGGVPTGRPTLIAGGAGCGKTLFGMEFLVRGALDYGEPGVFMAFEETAEDLAANVASLGFDLQELQERGLLIVDHVRLERSEIEEAGEYDLDGLFVRLGFAIDRIGAKRVVLDTLEVLFSALPNEAIIRSELRRLFHWLKDRGMTAIITAERGHGSTLTRHGLEEYVSDCVVMLDHRVHDQVSTRRLRVVKYRGSLHGTNEYPFLIDEGGINVLPVTSIQLDHRVSDERVSSGIPRLDTMLGGGFYRGSSILVTGTAGSGKSSLAASFADATCRRGEGVLYLAFEESQYQIVRNMKSIHLDLQQWVDKGLLHFHTVRPTLYGLETHLAVIHKLIQEQKPGAIVVDPVTNLNAVGTQTEIRSALMRLVDQIKSEQITGFFTSLTGDKEHAEQSEIGISSLMDTWILLRNLESNGERNRGLFVLKSRGTEHSNQIREFRITNGGIELIDVYVGTEGVLTGTARVAQEAREREETELRRQEVARRQRDLDRKRQIVEAQVAALRAELDTEADELERFLKEEALRATKVADVRTELATLRGGDDN